MPFLFKPFELTHKNLINQDDIAEQMTVLNNLKERLNQSSESTVSLLKDLSKITSESSHHNPEVFNQKLDEYALNLECVFKTLPQRKEYLLSFINKREEILNNKKNHHLLRGQHKEFCLLKESLSFNRLSATKLANGLDIEDAFQSLTTNDQSLASLLQLLIYLISQNRISLETKKKINSCLNHQIIDYSPLLPEIQDLLSRDQQQTLEESVAANRQGVHSEYLGELREQTLRDLTERYPLNSISSFANTRAEITQAMESLAEDLPPKEVTDINEVYNSLSGWDRIDYQDKVRRLWAAAKEDEDGQMAFFKALVDSGSFAYSGYGTSCAAGIIERLIDQVGSYLRSKRENRGTSTSTIYIENLRAFFLNPDPESAEELIVHLRQAYLNLYRTTQKQEIPDQEIPDQEIPDQEIPDQEIPDYEDQDIVSAQSIIDYVFENTLPRFIDPSTLNMEKALIVSSLEKNFFQYCDIGFLDEDIGFLDEPYKEAALRKFQQENTNHLIAFWKDAYQKFNIDNSFIPYFSDKALDCLFSRPYNYESMNKILDIYERNPYQNLIVESLKEVITTVIQDYSSLTGSDSSLEHVDNHPLVQIHQKLAGLFIKAAKEGRLDIVKALLDKGADVNQADRDGDTALIWAALNGHKDIVEALLGKDGIDVDKADRDGDTALIWAALYGHKDIVKALLDKGADVNFADNNGTTALILAAKKGHKDIVEALLGKDGIDVDKADRDGTTALIWAARNGHTDIVKALLDKGADVNFADNNGTTALILAAVNGHKDIVEALLDKGASVDKADNNGDTALLHAAKKGYIECMRALIEAGAKNVDKAYLAAPYGSSKTFLDFINAVQSNDLARVNLLIKGGANLESKDNNGNTAFILAARNGHTECVHILKYHKFQKCVDALREQFPLSDDCQAINTIIDKLNKFKSDFEESDNKSEGFRNFQKKVEKYICEQLRTNPALKIHEPLKIALLNILLAIGTCGGSLIYGVHNRCKGGNFLFFSKNQLGKELNNARRHLV